MPDSTPRPWLSIPAWRRPLGWLLTTYWVALFVSTHSPIPPELTPPEGGDKLIHLAAYAGLAFLLSLWLSARQPFRGRQATLAVFVVCLFGVVDELLQIPMNRHAEWRDWLADCLGGTLGLLGFAMFHALAPQLWRYPAESGSGGAS